MFDVKKFKVHLIKSYLNLMQYLDILLREHSTSTYVVYGPKVLRLRLGRDTSVMAIFETCYFLLSVPFPLATRSPHLLSCPFFFKFAAIATTLVSYFKEKYFHPLCLLTWWVIIHFESLNSLPLEWCFKQVCGCCIASFSVNRTPPELLLIEDPYDFDEPDPSKSKALESSLWELKVGPAPASLV